MLPPTGRLQGFGALPGLAAKGLKAGTEVLLLLALEKRVDGIFVGYPGQILGIEGSRKLG